MSALQQVLLAGGGDPYYANVSLLLHMDGTNGSTTFTDNSPSPKTVSSINGTSISTSVVKFGTGSGSFSGYGANQFLSVSPLPDFAFGTGDFTIEFQTYPTNISGAYGGAGLYMSGPQSNAGEFLIYWESSVLTVRTNDGGSYYYLTYIWPIGLMNVWSYVAVVRKAGVITIYVNGNSVTSGTLAQNIPASSFVYIGTFPGAIFYYGGYLDEFRVTKGVARYTANFTPPTGPFPNS